MADEAPAATKSPADFLKSIKGRPVVVKLNSGVEYRGAPYLPITRQDAQRWALQHDDARSARGLLASHLRAVSQPLQTPSAMP